MKIGVAFTFSMLFLLVSAKVFPQAGNGNSPPRLSSNLMGIGVFIDSATNLSRSFNVYDLLKRNTMSFSNQKLNVVLAEAFPFQFPIGITGRFGAKYCELKVFKDGKKHRVLKCDKDWKSVLRNIQVVMEEFGYRADGPFKDIKEGSVAELGSGSISEFLPGSMVYEIPPSRIADSLKNFIKLKNALRRDPYENVSNVFGNYAEYKENDIYFFRSEDVPDDLKEAVRPLVYPHYNSLSPSLRYMSNGALLKSQGDLGASLNAFYAAVNSSNRLIASRCEKALVRGVIFSELTSIYRDLVMRPNTAALYELCARLNRSFVRSDEGLRERQEYLLKISEVRTLAVQAENEAKRIRAANRTGAILAVTSAAGSISSAAAGNAAQSNLQTLQMQTAMEQYGQAADDAKALLESKFQNIDDKINTEGFLAGEDAGGEALSPIVASEVFYFLKLTPQRARAILESFAADKPKLQSLTSSYFTADDQGKKRAQQKLMIYLIELERLVINVEVRKRTVDIASFESKFIAGEGELDKRLDQLDAEERAFAGEERTRVTLNEKPLDILDVTKILVGHEWVRWKDESNPWFSKWFHANFLFFENFEVRFKGWGNGKVRATWSIEGREILIKEDNVPYGEGTGNGRASFVVNIVSDKMILIGNDGKKARTKFVWAEN